MNTYTLTDEIRTEICDWIYECGQFESEEEEREARGGTIDKHLQRYIDKNFSGGMEEFIRISEDYKNQIWSI